MSWPGDKSYFINSFMPGSESKHSTDVANENESRVGRLICLRITRLRLTQSNEWRALSSTVLASVTEFWLFLEFFGDFNVSFDGNAPNSIECFDSGPGIIEVCQKIVTNVTNSSLTVKCQCYPRGSNKSILIPPSVKKYVIFTINSLVRFAHSFVYLVKMTYFFPSVGIKKLLFSPLG